MFFILPWKLNQPGLPQRIPWTNLLLIAINVLLFLGGWAWVVGPGSRLSSIVLYAFSHGSLWHLVLNMWALWVFGNPVNQRLGHGFYLLAYLGSAVVLGLLARWILAAGLLGSSGAVFAVMTIAFLLMPAAKLEVACIALFPLTVLIGLMSKPAQAYGWLVRWVTYAVHCLWALVIVFAMELVLWIWSWWHPTHSAHLLGMLCGLAVVLLLPTRITMFRRPAAGGC
jgi:membrane associated rhomboid family serine protease